MYSPVSKVVGHPQKHGKNSAVQAARKIQFFPCKFHHPESKNAESSEVSITRVRWQESGTSPHTLGAHIIKIKFSAKASQSQPDKRFYRIAMP
jgi:hypothetical protein